MLKSIFLYSYLHKIQEALCVCNLKDCKEYWPTA